MGMLGRPPVGPHATEPVVLTREATVGWARLNRHQMTVSVGVAAAAAAVVLLGRHALPRRVPDGIVLHGAVFGSLNALLAIGLVLIYRTNRIINFAQGALGAIAANLAQTLFQIHGWGFFPSVLVGIASAVLLSSLVEVTIIRRFSRSPRLILTVATIGVAQVLGAVELAVPSVLGYRFEEIKRFTTPFSFRFYFGGVFFRADHAVVLVAVPLMIVALYAFLRRTGYGLAARALAEKSDRARLLGVRARRVSLMVWALAGALSGVAAILRASITEIPVATASGNAILLRALAAAAIGRMESMTVAFVASVLLSVLEQQIYFALGKSGPIDGVLLAAIIVSLLLQRRRGKLDDTTSSWQLVQELRPVPKELRRLPEVRFLRWALAVAGIALCFVLPVISSPSRIYLVGVVFIYAMIGISLTMLTGWAGQVSLGQWALVGVGSFVAGRLATASHPSGFLTTLLAAGLAGMAVAVAIGLPALRIRGLFLAVTTMAFAIAAQSWIFQLDWLAVPETIPRPVAFGRYDLNSERAFYWVCLVGLVATTFVARNLRRSRFGRVLIAIRDNEREVQAMALSPARAKLAAFAVSGFVAGTAGALYAYSQQVVNSTRYPPIASLHVFTMAVIGGVGSLSGALLGAIAIQGTRYFLPGYMQYFVTGIGLLVMLLVFPGGLGQVLSRLRDAYLRWVAGRRRIVVPSLTVSRAPPDVPAVAAAGG